MMNNPDNSPNPQTVQASAQLGSAPAPSFRPEPPMPTRRYRHRPSLFWPVVLIGGGIALLLANTGLLPPDWWVNLWRLWPVLLILAGLDILLGRRSGWGAVVGLILGLLVIALVFGLAFYPLNRTVAVPGAFTFGRPVATQAEHRSIPLGETSRADVSIDLSVFPATITSLDDSPSLVDANLTTFGNLRFDSSGPDTQRSVHISESGVNIPFWNFGSVGAGNWDIRLNQSPTYSLLQLHGGVGRWDMNLTHLKVEQVQISSGVGNAVLELPQSGQVSGSINGGVGSLELVVPQGTQARFNINAGVGSVNVDNRFTRSGSGSERGGVYQTSGYSSDTSNRIDITVDGGVGSITIR